MKKYNIILWLFLPTVSFGQNLKSLQSLIDFAIQNNQNIAINLKNIEMQKSMVNTYREMPKAIIELQYGNIQNPNVNDYTISAKQNFELPKVYNLKKDYYQSFVGFGEAQLEFQKSEITYQISNNYYELAALNDLEIIYNQDLAKLDNIKRIVNKKLSEGDIDKSEVLYIDLKISEINQKKQNLELLKQNYLSNLKTLLNTNQLPDIQFDKTSISNSIGKMSNGILAQKNEEIKISEAETNLEKSKLKPTIITGFINQSMMGFHNQFIGVGGIEIPLFSKSQKSRVEASKINTEIKKIELEKLAFQIEREINKIKTEKAILESKIIDLEENIIPKYESLIEIYDSKYKAGVIEYSDWYLPFNQFLSTKEQLTTTRKEINLKNILLKYLIGNEK